MARYDNTRTYSDGDMWEMFANDADPAAFMAQDERIVIQQIGELCQEWGEEVDDTDVDLIYRALWRHAADQLTDRAKARLAQHPALEPYEDIIYYDWPEGDDHALWLCTAEISEILSWAQGIRQDEETNDMEAGPAVVAARMIRRYDAPLWVVVAMDHTSDSADLAAINDAGFEVLDTNIMGWGDYNAIIRVTDGPDYLAKLV
jgi:hypothetical protein